MLRNSVIRRVRLIILMNIDLSIVQQKIILVNLANALRRSQIKRISIDLSYRNNTNYRIIFHSTFLTRFGINWERFCFHNLFEWIKNMMRKYKFFGNHAK